MRATVNPWEPPASLNRYEYSVFDICEQLHMSNTGSGDPLTDEVWSMYMAEIIKRLAEWKPNASSETYDGAVKALIVATLREQAELP